MYDPLPPAARFHFCTSEMDPAERRDAWKEIAHRWVDFKPAPDVPLQGEMTILTSEACTMGTTCSSAYEMSTGARCAHPDDMVVLTLIQSGQLVPQVFRRKGAGDLSLCAPREEGRFRWAQGTRQAFLALPRQEVCAALGHDPATLLVTGNSALAPALIGQMNHMALLLRQPHLVDEVEFAGLLDATRALALLTLRNLGRQGISKAGAPRDAHEGLHAGRRAAALRFMELHAHRADLDAAAIAQGAGCSRTRLYEAFAAQGMAVMDTLRELRLQRAKVLIEQSARLHVGTVSWRCGFASQSGFSKLFRARFGMSPSECHQQRAAQAA
jgi:AraC-like DNA-binding protein